MLLQKPVRRRLHIRPPRPFRFGGSEIQTVRRRFQIHPRHNGQKERDQVRLKKGPQREGEEAV